MGIRKGYGAKELKQALLERGEKVRAITKDPELNNVLSRTWANRVKRFVPRSDLPESRHHLQTYEYSDNRILWYRYNSSGEDITGMLYDGSALAGRYKNSKEPKTAQWNVRAEGATEYGPHEPTEYWNDMVKPGTVEWSGFVEEVAPIVSEAVRKGLIR